MTTKIAVLQLGGLKLAVGPGVLTVFDFNKVDVPLIWVELTGFASLGCGGVAVAGAKSSLFPLRPPALLTL